MKSVYLLVLVSFCQGLPMETRLVQLAAPSTVQVTVMDPPSIKVSWNKIASGDAKDPVIGYKVMMWKVKNVETIRQAVVQGQVIQSVEESAELKVWEIQKIKVTKYKKQGDEIVRVLEESYPEMNINEIPSGVPTEIVTPADETTAIFHGVKDDVPYQFAVQAFTAEGDGPLSGSVRITLLPRNKAVANEDDLLGKTETRY